MNEKKNDLIEEWCIAVDCLFNWLVFYVCVEECEKEVKEGWIWLIEVNIVCNSNNNE